MSFTPGNDINVIQGTDAGTVVGAGLGDDTYILTPFTLTGGEKITISDAQGANSLQLVGGLGIASSQIASDTMVLTLTNGTEVTVMGASTFTYEPGGNKVVGIDGADVDYSTFVTKTLGSTVPTGSTVNTGGAVTVGGTAATYTLTSTAGSVVEGSPLVFTFTASTAPTVDTSFNIAVVGDTLNGAAAAATPGSDLIGAPTSVTLLANQKTATFSITPTADGVSEGVEGVKVSILNGATSVAATTFLINDLPADTTKPVVAASQAYSYGDNVAASTDLGIKVQATDNVGVTGYTIASGDPNKYYSIDSSGNVTLTTAGVAAGATSHIAGNTITLGITATDLAKNVSDPVNVALTVTDKTSPTLATTNPAVVNGAGTTAYLNFTETLANTGSNLPVVSDFSVVAGSSTAINVTNVTISGSTVVLTLASAPPSGAAVSITYTPNATASKVLQDAAGNKVATIVSQAALVDSTAPTLSTSTPADNATNIALTDNIVLSMSETVKAGTGNIVITDVNNIDTARTIAIGDTTQVTFSGNTVTINPTADLKTGAHYVVTVNSGVIKDVAGNDFAGISGTNLDFYTSGASSVGQTFTLTNAVDAIPGLKGSLGTTDTGGDDTIIGNMVGNTTDTVQVADQVNAGGGTDTFKEYLSGNGSVVLPQLTGVENVFISGSGGVTLDFSALAGVTGLEINKPVAANTSFTLNGAIQAFTSSQNGAAPAATAYDSNLIYGSTNTAANITVSAVGNESSSLTPNLSTIDAKGAALATVNLVSTGTVSGSSNLASGAALVNLGAANAVVLNNTTATTVTNTVNISGDSKLYLDLQANAGNFDKLATVNANTDTGGVWVIADVQKSTFAFTGGSGNDVLKLEAGDLTALTSGAQLDGGGGVNAIYIKDTAPATTDYAALNAAKNFQVLGLTTAATTIDVSKFTSINKFVVGATGDTFNNAKATSAFQLDNTAGLAAVTVNNATGEVATTINIDNQSSANKIVTTLTTKVSTINLSSTGNTGATNTITTLANADGAVVNVTGDHALTLTLSSTAVTGTGSKVDASTFTGKLTVTGAGVTTGDVLIGGSLADTLTVAATTNETSASVLTGNGGNDTFNASAAVYTANKLYTTITDFTKGDILQFASKGTETFATVKVDVGAASTLSAALGIATNAVDGSANGAIKWFQYGGNTYVVEAIANAAAHTGTDANAADLVVKLTGVLDLSTSIIDATNNILTFA